MSETNIGSNLPKAHGTQPSFEGKQRANSETPLPKSEATTTQKDINLDRDPAAVAGRSQVKKSGKKPYVYKPENTISDAENFRLLDKSFGTLAKQISEKHGIPLEDAQLFLYESIADELAA